MSARCSPRLPAHLLASVDTRGPTSDRTRLCRTPVEPGGSTLKRHSPPDQPIVGLLPPGRDGFRVRLYALVQRHRPTGDSSALDLDYFVEAMLLPPFPDRRGRLARLRWIRTLGSPARVSSLVVPCTDRDPSSRSSRGLMTDAPWRSRASSLPPKAPRESKTLPFAASQKH